jgi:branched-chain amino acid transport system ATP-binding protein
VILLDIRNLTKHFGGLAAINNLNIHVDQGEIFGIIGPNGAGKSTVMNMIGGSIKPTSGACIFKDENITGLPSHRISQKGISRVYQGNILFQNLTVLDNVIISTHMRNNSGFLGSLVGTRYSRNQDKNINKKATDILASVGLTDKIHELAVNLSHGNQRLLCLATALAGDPTLLLLDEPLTGMNTKEVSAMMSIVRMLRDEMGVTSIVVEHNMKAVMSLCDRIVVISYGSKIAEGPPKDVANNPIVIDAYLGAEQDDIKSY